MTPAFTLAAPAQLATPAHRTTFASPAPRHPPRPHARRHAHRPQMQAGSPSQPSESPLRNLLTLAATAVSITLAAPAAPAHSAPPAAAVHVHTAAPARRARRPVLRVHAPPPSVRAAVAAPAAPASVAPASAAAPAAPATTRPSLRDVLSFWMGEYLMWNPGAKVVSLLAIILTCMYLGSFLYRLADPKGQEASSPFWHSVRAIANPLEDDWDMPALRTTSIALATIGMVVFAIMVGMVTESVESAVQNADGENSTVVVRDHILVCGWSSHVTHILKDVSSVGSRTKVVVMANPHEKSHMLAELRTVLSDAQRKNLRVFYRPGAPILQDDLRRVAAESAKKIILVNTRSGDLVDADRRILSRALALRQNLPAFRGDIVAELNNARDEGILRSILSDTLARSVETVNAERLLFRFMAQAIRQPGLADVVARLMGNNPASVFHVMTAREAAPQLVGTNYADVRPTSIPGSIICGFFDDDGKVHMRAGHSFDANGPVLEASTQLLLLGSSQRGPVTSDGTVANFTSKQVSNAVYSMRQLALRKGAESYLVCGWRPDMEDMLRELDNVLASGSKVTVLDIDAPDSLHLGLKNVSVSCIRKRADRYENLEEVLNAKSKPYDHIVLLGSALGDETELKAVMGREEDTKTLASLVYVNELLSKQQEAMSKKKDQKATLVTVEFINEGVASIAKTQGNVANAILPQNLSAKIAAQTVRDSRLNAVWNELLSQEGREVYLKPCQKYVGDGERASFVTVADRTAELMDDIVIGYVDEDGKVVINPQGSERFKSREWKDTDALIVLCMD